MALDHFPLPPILVGPPGGMGPPVRQMSGFMSTMVVLMVIALVLMAGMAMWMLLHRRKDE